MSRTSAGTASTSAEEIESPTTGTDSPGDTAAGTIETFAATDLDEVIIAAGDKVAANLDEATVAVGDIGAIDFED